MDRKRKGFIPTLIAKRISLFGTLRLHNDCHRSNFEKNTNTRDTSQLVRGFTILEIMVVISIMIMLSGLALSYRASMGRQIALYVEAQKMAELILRAKSLAIATYNDNPSGVPITVTCGYGVDLDYGRRRYSLFSYRQPIGQSCESISRIETASSTVLAEHSLTPGVSLDNGEIDSIYKVLFVPPVPLTLISFQSGGDVTRPVLPGKIYLRTTDSRFNIGIGSLGQVDF